MESENDHAARSAWIVWAVLFLATAVIIVVSGNTRSVVINYRLASLAWIDGRALYELNGLGGFTYLPQAAILFIPFSLLPEIAGEVVWRLVNLAVFVLGVRSFARLASNGQDRDLFPLVTLVALPIAWDCARNGQATLIMAGLMLLAVADLARERWWRSAVLLSLSVAVKPIAIVLPLLVVALHRPMAWRLPAALAAVAVMPFLAQRPSFALEQYAGFLQNTLSAAHIGAVDAGFTTPFNALRVMGVTVPEVVQTVIRLAAAAGTLVLAAVARRRKETALSSVFLYALAAAYLMLFSPRTENNTYAMLGPAMGAFLARAFLVERFARTGALLGAMTVTLLASRQLQRILTPQADTSWIPPLLAVGFLAFLIKRLLDVEPASAPRA